MHCFDTINMKFIQQAFIVLAVLVSVAVAQYVSYKKFFYIFYITILHECRCFKKLLVFKFTISSSFNILQFFYEHCDKINLSNTFSFFNIILYSMIVKNILCGKLRKEN